MAAKLWQGVGVSVQSALASALVITGISKAATAVVTYSTGTDPANGDYVYIQGVTGMSQVNERVFRIANVNAAGNTFELEGIDSQAFDTYASGGTAQVITYGTTLDSLVDLSASGGEPEQKDQTTIHDTVRKTFPGVLTAISYSFTALWDPSSSGLLALKSASDVKAKRAFRFTFPDATKVVFVGYVSTALLPAGSAQENVTTPVTISMNGTPSYYTT